MSGVLLAWFRQDLRVRDNPILAAAAASPQAVLPVYIHSPQEADEWSPGGASCWWLHRALQGLEMQLAGIGLPLVIRSGPSLDALRDIVAALQSSGLRVEAVLSSRLVEPALVCRDEAVRASLAANGIGWRQFNASLLFEPEQVRTRSGDPFRVFTPFWKHLRSLPAEAPVEFDAGTLRAPAKLPASLPLAALGLLPHVDWAAEFPRHWEPSPAGARLALEEFINGRIAGYRQQRDLPAIDGTSRLSPYLHFGQIGPRQVWAAVHAAGAQEGEGGFTFLAELAWREFAYHLLHHFPHTTDAPMQAKYRSFPWQPNPAALAAWQQGRTGYPFVDAGMRQLWRTGWMHNRVRMVVASFLVKHLLQPWQQGARWFWDTLVDADLASNTMGWQWVAGSGADAAPYFRIFNPVMQGQKFDPQGRYVREYVPEIAKLPDAYIHCPWEAPAGTLAAAGVQLGEIYPAPIIGHREGRERALAALARIRGR